jgi:peptidoglycan/LPS O-acetylase OafA/YrhL
VEPNNIWTLRHEAIFYSLFALSLLPLKPKPWILGVWALSPLAYAVLSLPQSPSTPWLQFVRIVTNPCNIEFATGVAIGLAWHKWTNSWEISLPLPSGITILAVFALFWTLNYEINVGVDTLYACAISSLTGGLIVFLAIHLDCTAGYLERLLSYLGEASFSIYLFHPHFTSAMLGLWSKHFRATPAAVVLVGTSVVAVIGAVIIYEYIERPVHRLAFRFLSKRL